MDKKGKIIIVVIVLLLLSAGGAFGVFLMTRQKNDDTNDDDTNDDTQPAVPQYALYTTPSSAVEEGNSLSINLTTSNVSDDTLYYYQITGVQQADFSSGQISDTSGLRKNDFPINFQLLDEKPVLTASGGSTESSGETLKFNLYSDPEFTTLLTDITVTINDSGSRTIDLQIENIIIPLGYAQAAHSFWKVTGRDRLGLVESDNNRTHNRTPNIRVKRGDVLKFTKVPGGGNSLNITYMEESGFNNWGNFPDTSDFEYLQNNGGSFNEVESPADSIGITLGTITWNTENATAGLYYYNNNDEFTDQLHVHEVSLPSGVIEIVN